MIARGGRKERGLKGLCDQILNACPLCVISSLGSRSRKVSIKHVRQEFNQEIEADFMFVNIQGTKYCALRVIDTGTRCLDTAVVSKLFADTMANTIGTSWILTHGSPSNFSADSEFTHGRMRKFLYTDQIIPSERPVRRHNKTEIITRKHRTVKRILERLQNDTSDASDTVLLARTKFLSHIFNRNSVLSAFELVHGYIPAILGANAKLVLNKLINAYKNRECVPVLQRLLNSRHPRNADTKKLSPSTPIYYNYKSSKYKDPTEWRAGTMTLAK